MEDNRKHQRLPEENRVAVTVVSAQNAPELEDQTFFCPTEDLSAGGLKLSVPSPLPSGSVVELRIALARPLRSFMHVGEVRWTREVDGPFPFAIGVKFTKLEGPNRALWEDMMNRKIGGAGKEQND
ncbi:MAG: PilZ domain-containing protein [Verrucomicrobia bacterium]|nr:PilZ domain-containing protein [Verrucomicrobiota bacterium]